MPDYIIWRSDYHNHISCSREACFSLFGKKTHYTWQLQEKIPTIATPYTKKYFLYFFIAPATQHMTKINNQTFN
jgi:hypothetical protein